MSNNQFKNKLNQMNQQKPDVTEPQRPNIVQQLTKEQPEEETVDFAKMAEELKERQKEQQDFTGANDGFVKETLYIRQDVHKAFTALCIKRGDKKTFANEAIADFVQKKYNEIMKKS